MESAFFVIDRVTNACGAPESWPLYSTRLFSILILAALAMALVQFCTYEASAPSQKTSTEMKGTAYQFRIFQLQYLVVYLLIMLADWLQGTNMYTLYDGYDMPIGTLFLTGFTSSAVFGTFIGLYADKYGRKLGCVVFCILEIIINTLEHYPNFALLMVGRVLGGISTSILFSAFESWMVTEHRARKYPDAWLASTNALASVGNGIMAIVAGVLAQIAADAYGDIGPFRLAILLTAVALVLISMWRENYGTECSSDSSTFSIAFREITTKREIMLVGLVQAFYEGAMYTFVFMWVPTVLKLASEPPPIGVLFACMMVCVTMGGLLFTPLLNLIGIHRVSILICALSGLTMLIPVFSSSYLHVLASFLVLEACVGCWFATSATMRSMYVPEGIQSSIMTVFRIPLNVLVVIGTKMTELTSPDTVFKSTAAWFFISCVFQIMLKYNANPQKID